jgi:hypothetical protein
MRFAYADPPYLGQGLKHYKSSHRDAAVWDSLDAHRDLIARLVADYPDGWALSASSPSLRVLLPMCPDDIRVGAWVKPFASFKPNVNPAYAWEPVLFRGGRPHEGRDDDTVRDWHSENITLHKGLSGAKPKRFPAWLLDLLNVRRDLGDTIDDLFPGTGGVSIAWAQLALRENSCGGAA